MMSQDSSCDQGGRPLAKVAPVAIVGISCRFPEVNDPRAFWRMLADGETSIGERPPERRFADPPSQYEELPDGMRRGGFLSQVDSFDAGFFGVAPREAAVMDPQQRLMLELAWEAFEDAGVIPVRDRDNDIGVFVGTLNDDYSVLAHQQGADAVTAHTLAGLSRGIIANRVSYVFGLSGPSLTVDAAQASALTATNLARESVARGESELALAGGVNLILSPLSTLAAARFGALSPDGRCSTFDARANGYVRGEGGGFVLLKRLDSALDDGDHIYSVLHGGAVNNDGHTRGLTVPSSDAQEAVMRAAYTNAGIEPSDVDYVELHGTGTPTGDPCEAHALGAVFGPQRLTPLRVGSVKTNIGHLEGASGIAGLIKAALSIQNRKFSPSLNFTHPNPAIPLEDHGITVQTSIEPWTDPEDRYLAGVSSFGMGGSNCHLVLGAPPGHQRGDTTSSPEYRDEMAPLVISGHSANALRGQAAALATHLDSVDSSLMNVAFSLATTRASFDHRAVVMAENQAEAVAALRALASGERAAQVRSGKDDKGATAVLFSGQGAQRAEMGARLAEAFPEFERSLTEVCAQLEGMGAASPREAMFAPEGTSAAERLHQTGTTQPALFAFEVALFHQLRAWGVTPDFVAGHSVGEVAAAHVAGVLSLADACALISARGALMQELPAGGGMLSIRLSEKEITSILTEYADRVGIAAVNSPSSTVVSGDAESLATLAHTLKDQGVRTTELRVSHAFHSMQMEPMLDRFREVLRGLTFRPPHIPLISNVTGGPVTDEIATPDYWVRHARHAVRFADSVTFLSDAGVRTFVEIGPGRALSALAEQCLDPADGVGVIPVLPGKAPEDRQLFEALSGLHVRGVALDWASVFARHKPTRALLPTYAFQRTRHWLEEVTTAETESSVPKRAEPADTAPDTDLAAGTVPEPDTSPLATKLAGLNPEEQRDLLNTLVCGAVAWILGFSHVDAVDSRQTFHDLGCDSVMSVELRERLMAETDVPLPATLVFDHPTPEAVAELLHHSLCPGNSTAEPATATPSTTSSEAPSMDDMDDTDERSAEIDSMSADDLVRLALDTPAAPESTDLGGRDDH